MNPLLYKQIYFMISMNFNVKPNQKWFNNGFYDFNRILQYSLTTNCALYFNFHNKTRFFIPKGDFPTALTNQDLYKGM